jgi:hypothetical protein
MKEERGNHRHKTERERKYRMKRGNNKERKKEIKVYKEGEKLRNRENSVEIYRERQSVRKEQENKGTKKARK